MIFLANFVLGIVSDNYIHVSQQLAGTHCCHKSAARLPPSNHTYRYDNIQPISMIASKLVPKAIDNARKKGKDIVLAAIQLFLNQGYAATSMDRIAAHAGVTKQTVYRYFPSKEELFGAVLTQVRDAYANAYVFGTGPVVDELTEFGRQLLAFHLQPEPLGLYKLMLTEGVREDLNPIFMSLGPQRVMQPLVAFLERRCDALEDSAFHAQMFATMILAPRTQLLMGTINNINRTAQKAHVEKVVALFLKALAPYLEYLTHNVTRSKK